MTVYETRFFETAIAFFTKASKKKEIDWEERKWDLVVKMCAAREGASFGASPANDFDRIFSEAETIVEKYREREIKENE